MIAVTEAFIRSGANGPAGYCAPQLKILGINWPPSKGWLKRIVDQHMAIDEESARLFVGYGHGAVTKKQIKSHVRRNRVVRKLGVEAAMPEMRRRVAKDFLQSYEWRCVRYAALKKYGAKCMCCGATPESGATMNVDHILPRKDRPDLALDINNLQVLCNQCNHGKSNWDSTDWRDRKTRRKKI
mgnify:CR=1 FL=1